MFSDSAVFDYDQTATTPIHHPSEYNYSLTRPSDISTENLLLRENADDSLLPIPEITSHFESLLQILETAPLAESSSSVSSARTTVPEAAISIAETTDLEDNIEVNLSQTKIQQKTASSRLQADSSQPEGIQLPSLTATPTTFTTARAQTVRLRRSGWQRTKNASSRVQSEQALLSANPASNVEDSTNPETWQDSTAATAAEFQRLLNSFVQFDTFESVTSEIARLSDWLTEQLETDRELQTDTLTTDVDPADSYAEQPATQESDDTGNQQPKHAWSRIDFGGPVEHILVTLSESPPDPPEISGLWQQIKFDCNPRGPPCSEGLPASENTRLHSSVSQLQQLRYCIAPRGPSAASVN